VESLRKLATIFVSFLVLSCRMLPLEDRKDQRAFLAGLVSTIPSTLRRMRRPDRRSIWMKGSTDSPISAFVSQKVVWACLHMPRFAKREAFLARLTNSLLAKRRAPPEGIEQRPGHRDLAHFTILGQNYARFI
jgi:hypothetical protein